VKTVLEVAVYALKKLKSIAQNASYNARPHFICRDINSGSIADISSQFDKIKAGLNEAAKAADTTLNCLI